MRIAVAFTSQLRVALGTSGYLCELPEGAQWADLMAALASRHGDAFRALVVDQQDQLRPAILLSIDDRQWLPGQAIPLRDGMQVTFLSAISGG